MPAAAECFQYFAGWADKIHGETIPVKGNYLTYTLREPVGVVAAIVPWNFPLLLTAWKVAPALACGNTVIIKPASQTPLTALALAEIAQEVGLPPGVLNVVTGPGSTVGQMHRRASRHRQDRVHRRHVAPARASCAASAETLKKITLELGGKSPNIVFADADLDAAVRGATTGIFYGKGEVCAAGSRLLVDKSIKNEFIDKVAARAKKMVAGRSARSEDAPRRDLLEEAARERSCATSRSAKKEGAKLVAGGGRADIGTGKGYFLQPTVFDGVTPEMTIAREEIFGPVLAAIEFADVDEAIARANDSSYGLAAAVWTQGHQEGALRRAQAPGRHGLDQHLQRLRHRGAVRRLQAERLRPRDEHARARALHAGEECLGGSESCSGTLVQCGLAAAGCSCDDNGSYTPRIAGTSVRAGAEASARCHGVRAMASRPNLEPAAGRTCRVPKDDGGARHLKGMALPGSRAAVDVEPSREPLESLRRRASCSTPIR